MDTQALFICYSVEKAFVVLYGETPALLFTVHTGHVSDREVVTQAQSIFT